MIRSLLFAAVLAALAISTQVRLPLSILFVGDEAALAKVSPLDETNSSSDVASVGRERSGDGYPLIRPLLVLLQPAVIWRQAARSTPCFDGWYSLSSSQAFVASPLSRPALTTTTSLDASRINAKQEKRKRNRENMRKFKKGGKRGTSKKKMMRKMQSGIARQTENEFIAKCFMTVPPPNSDEKA
eukprot:g8218.t2 g8218  g8218.t1 contig29:27121-27938(-)